MYILHKKVVDKIFTSHGNVQNIHCIVLHLNKMLQNFELIFCIWTELSLPQ